MHSRRPSPLLHPLAIVLPHPPLPRRRSSLLSSANSAASPHTPRSCASPTCSSIFFSPANNRKSTDSWNSSNGPDDIESEWKPEQVLLLSRTLDALPAHLVTPFNGPIPPSNLLDKIARGVSDAKGPTDWPHSIRATRVKLIELARLKAKEDALADQHRRIIAEEPEIEIEDPSNYSYFHNGIENPMPIGARRPLYRQSSMDFMNALGADFKDKDNISPVATRLQRVDRNLNSAGYHPYSRTRPQAHRRTSSPPRSTQVPSLINPSTPSSSTLNSLSSFASRPRGIRTSISTTSLSSAGAPILDPRVQRVRLSDPFCAPPPVPPPKDTPSSVVGVKRAPSFGALAQEVKREHGHSRKLSAGSYPSSDEEEKMRTQKAKKPRTKTKVSTAPPPSSPSIPNSSVPPSPVSASSSPPAPPAKDRNPARSKSKGLATCKEGIKSPRSPSAKTSKDEKNAPPAAPKARETKAIPKMSLVRNPSMFGAELPRVGDLPASPSPKSRSSPAPRASLSPAVAAAAAPRALSPAAPITHTLSPPPTIASSPPSSQKVKTLRRVRRLAPARRISFGSLRAPAEDGDADCEGDDEPYTNSARVCLGSAFQLH